MNARKLNPRSLENLDPNNRNRGKIRCNFTILPETREWLSQRGNASATIDSLVTFYRQVEDVMKAVEADEMGYRRNSFSKGLRALEDALRELY